MIDLTGGCSRHRAALLDFAVAGDGGPSTASALDHVDRCGRCLAELESTVLAVAALRRLGTELATVEPPPDAWPRLRSTVVRGAAPRVTLRSPIAGMAMSLAIVVVSVLGGAGLARSTPETAGDPPARPSGMLGPVEEAWLRERLDPARRPAPHSSPAVAPVTPTRPASWTGPDGMGVPSPVPSPPRNVSL